MNERATNVFPTAARLSALALAVLLSSAGLQTAHAAEQDLAERVRALEEALAAVKAQAQAAEASKSASAGNVVSIQERGGRMQLATADGNFTFRIGGRLLLDTAWYDTDLSPMGSGTKFRAARLEAMGTLYKDWSYIFQYDFTGSGEGGIKDAYLGYHGFKPADRQLSLYLGNQFQPFGFQGQQSPKYTLFMEQPTSSLLLGAGERRLGGRSDLIGSNWRWSFGAAQAVLGSRASEANRNDPVDLATQFTFNPIQEKGHVLNLGASLRHQSSNGSDAHRQRTRPQTHISSFRPVDTGDFISDGFTSMGVQAVYQRGPFELESEYFQQKYDAIQGGLADGEKPEFTGGYVQAGFFLTGESRAYDAGRALFAAPTPARSLSQGGPGAWQLAAGYSTLDLSDGSVDGGKIDMLMLGVNWYPEQRLRLSLEYGNALKVDGGPSDGDEPSFVQARAQIEW
ncbi:OprO/OprP family phosphate-selective porin [Stutzerimonas nitrititolerans]|uniref:OprO/OprP family phosphate-selective porin n=1 Tax=Stutzerimonas nitrititolerans TaxID=2482751 RepID=UPI0028A01CD4|nr:porin [Stutzerimonas nitrititolerans]